MDHAKLQQKPARPPREAALPVDITLLLRAHAEGCFLAAEVLPALGAVLQARGEEEREGAVAYLKGRWSQARLQALATDSSFEALRAAPPNGRLARTAARYYLAVRELRARARNRIESLAEE